MKLQFKKGVSGCIEHITMIWEAIQNTKSNQLSLCCLARSSQYSIGVIWGKFKIISCAMLLLLYMTREVQVGKEIRLITGCSPAP